MICSHSWGVPSLVLAALASTAGPAVAQSTGRGTVALPAWPYGEVRVIPLAEYRLMEERCLKQAGAGSTGALASNGYRVMASGKNGHEAHREGRPECSAWLDLAGDMNGTYGAPGAPYGHMIIPILLPASGQPCSETTTVTEELAPRTLRSRTIPRRAPPRTMPSKRVYTGP